MKVTGAGHSFSAIARPHDIRLVIDPSGSPPSVAEDGVLRASAGAKLHDLAEFLARRGWALPVLGDIDQQTLGGAVATSTHGTGQGSFGLASHIRGFTVVVGDGTVHRCSPSENTRLFRVGRVGLGALGVVTDLDIACAPLRALEAVESVEPLAAVLADIENLPGLADHVEFFWFPGTTRVLLKRHFPAPQHASTRGRLSRLLQEEVLGNGAYGVLCAVGGRWPSAVPLINDCVSRLLGAHYVDTPARVVSSPRRVRFVEMEYAIPRSHLPGVLPDVVLTANRHAGHVPLPVEVRFGAADDIPLSLASGRETAYVAVHALPTQERMEYFTAVERIMVAADGRPHWGKLHSRGARQLQEVYPLWGDFADVRRRVDPAGVFSNDHLDTVLGT